MKDDKEQKLDNMGPWFSNIASGPTRRRPVESKALNPKPPKPKSLHLYNAGFLI